MAITLTTKKTCKAFCFLRFSSGVGFVDDTAFLLHKKSHFVFGNNFLDKEKDLLYQCTGHMQFNLQNHLVFNTRQPRCNVDLRAYTLTLLTTHPN